MTKKIEIKKGFSSVLLWSVISAAFIGPGTVTTCAKAGAQFGTSLIWALTFSTIATIVLQELVARVSIATGKNIGELMAEKYSGTKAGWVSKGLFITITFGCAAYETGNILGAIAGLRLIYPLPTVVYALVIAVICFFILNKGTIQQVSKLMGGLVFLMGLVFFYILFKMDIHFWKLLYSSFIPSFPTSSGTLIIGLIGTTIVPYNLFLASGINANQSLWEMRWGIILAVLIGGLISIAILISGTLVSDAFSYQAVFNAIKIKAGLFGAYSFAIGLFAAGFSSAITAPLAAAICAKSLLRNVKTVSSPYHFTWRTVLGIGVVFSILNIQPIPAIIAAQGINGLLLPIVCVALYLFIHDQAFLSKEYRHSDRWEFIYLFIIWVTSLLGIYNIQSAIIKALKTTLISEQRTIWISVILSTILVVMLKYDKKRG